MPTSVQLYSPQKFSDLKQILQIFESAPLAFDFETTGLSAIKNDIVSIGLSNGRNTVAINLPVHMRISICNWLNHQQLIAFNYIFDGAFMTKYTGQVIAPYADAMVMFKTLSNEGYVGQSWGLKGAMTSILGWDNKNSDEVREYMKTHKCAMHSVPFDILGVYNGLDALATYQLWEYLNSFTEMFPALPDFWATEWNTLSALLIEQYHAGIYVDVKYYTDYQNELKEQADKLYIKFITLCGEHITEYNNRAHAVAFPPYPENRKTNKDLSMSVNYKKYLVKEEAARYNMYFNIGSSQQIAWLFYDRLKFDIKKTTEGGAPCVDKTVLHLFGEYGKLLRDYRKVVKEIGTVQQVLDDQVKGRVHPSVRIHGTITGRGSSGEDKG